MKTYLVNKPVCAVCGKPLILDDVDFRFNGCEDEYWICDNCHYFSLVAKIRYGQVFNIDNTFVSGYSLFKGGKNE